MGDVVYLKPPMAGIFPAKARKKLALPYVTIPTAGTTPTVGDTANYLDLNRLLLNHPTATYYLRVTNDAMIGAGIGEGDMLVIDRSLSPESGDIILAVLDGQVTVKRLLVTSHACLLTPENPRYQPVRWPPDRELPCWGVVTHVIHPTA